MAEVDVAAINRCPLRFYRGMSFENPEGAPSMLSPRRGPNAPANPTGGAQDTPNILRKLK